MSLDILLIALVMMLPYYIMIGTADYLFDYFNNPKEAVMSRLVWGYILSLILTRTLFF